MTHGLGIVGMNLGAPSLLAINSATSLKERQQEGIEGQEEAKASPSPGPFCRLAPPRLPEEVDQEHR